MIHTAQAVMGVRRRYSRLAAFVLSLCFPILPGLSGQVQPAAGSDHRKEYTISVDVELVILHVIVRDRTGNFVLDLSAPDFRVYEDGVRQNIKFFRREDVPVTVGLVVDNSGSMRRKRAEVTAAALTFARSSNPQDEMFVVGFNEEVWLGLPAGKAFTNNPEQLTAGLNGMGARGQTALYDAVATALEHLKKGTRDKKVLIVVSDGGDNASRETFPAIMKRAESSTAIIYTIGLFDEWDKDRNPGVLKRLASVTGAESFFPAKVGEAVGICERIAKDIRNEYTIGYTPTNRAQDGSYRTIRVTVTAPHHGKLSVRTRIGYIAPSEGLQTGGVTAGGR